MNLFKKILKGLFALLLILIAGGVSYYLYEENERNKRDEQELAYASKQKWEWHDKYDRIQIHKIEKTNLSILRRVHIRDRYVVYARKNDDYSLSTMVKFVTPCKPSSEIETSEKFSDGTPKKLQCNEDGDSLNYTVSWNGKETDITWDENLGGFSVRENFANWDFSKLDQEITLSKSK